MSLAWKVTVTVVLFAVAAAAAVVLIVNLLGTAARRSTSPPSPQAQPVNVTLQTVGTYGSGSHPTWVSYLVEVARGPVGPHHAVPGSRARPHQRHDLPVRLGQPAAQPAARPGHRDLRQRGHASTAGRSGSSTRTPATASPTPSPCPRSGINVPLYGNNGNANLVRRGPLHHQVPAQGDQVLLHDPGPGQLPLAVLRALRPWLPLRQRRAHVDPRLHGRLHAGGRVSDPSAQRVRERRAAGDQPEGSGGRDAPLVAPDRHLGRPLRSSSTRSTTSWPGPTSRRAP